MTDSTPDLDAMADEICVWGAARAGGIILVPVLGTVALAANEAYMVSRIADIYGVELSGQAIKGFIGAVSGSLVGHFIAGFFPGFNIPIGVVVTYAVGKTAQQWIKDGMPPDVVKYKDLFEKAKRDARARAQEIQADDGKGKPLGDGA
jgi:uncharacterized protein (DUF697 family)